MGLFSIELCLGDLKKFALLFIFLATVVLTDMEFGVHIIHNVYRSSVVLSTIDKFLTDLSALDLEIQSFAVSVSSQMFQLPYTRLFSR